MELINKIDETISFNEKNIRIIGSYNEPWFVAKDICDILEIKDNRSALRIIPEKWKGEQLLPTLGGKQITSIINEAGLYKLIMRSNKPIAQKFQEVVCEEILPTLRKKGEYKIQSIIDRNKELEEEYQEKNLHIKKLEEKILKKQKRTVYSEKYCIYIVTSPVHIPNRTYIVGRAIDLTSRLGTYNKTLEHEMIYFRECKSVEHMNIIETMVLLKLDKYRERANRDRFILPIDEEISIFTDIVDDAINWFEDVQWYTHIYEDEELALTNEELEETQKNAKNNRIEYRKEYRKKNKQKLSDADFEWRENNKDHKAEIDKKYRENNSEKVAESKKIYYEKNKTEILEQQKIYNDNNKEIINQGRKIYREENKDKIKEEKKIYRGKYKEKINKKQNEIRKNKDNPIVECVCGIKLTLTSSKSKKHKNSSAHKRYIENNGEINNIVNKNSNIICGDTDDKST